MIPIIFVNGIHSATVEQAQALWTDGTIDRVRMDSKDYFMASDVALVLANQGLIHEDAFVKKFGVAKGGGQCGRGWVGVKGSCKRLAKGADRAGAQKSALKEFAQGQRVKKFGDFGTSGLQVSKQAAREAAGNGLPTFGQKSTKTKRPKTSTPAFIAKESKPTSKPERQSRKKKKKALETAKSSPMPQSAARGSNVQPGYSPGYKQQGNSYQRPKLDSHSRK